MSIPRVGSSRTRSEGAASIHLANTTFCWFPPDNAPTGWSTDAATTPAKTSMGMGRRVRYQAMAAASQISAPTARTLTSSAATSGGVPTTTNSASTTGYPGGQCTTGTVVDGVALNVLSVFRNGEVSP